MELSLRELTESLLTKDEKLRENEELFRSIFSLNPTPMVVTSMDGAFFKVNESFTKISGYTEEEVLGKTLLELKIYINPEDRVNKILDGIKRDGFIKNLSIKFRVKNGTILDTLVSTSIIAINKVKYHLSVIEDVTEQKKAEEALRRSEKYFKEITENSSDVIIITDNNGDIKYCSRSIERYTGYSPEELIGKSGFSFIHSDDVERAVCDFGKAILNEDYSIPNVFRILHKNGMVHYFEGLGKNLLDHPDVAGFIMNIHDITDRKLAEHLLLISEERYRTMIENATDMIFKTDENGFFIYVNPATIKITGYEIREIIGKHYKAIIHPDKFEECITFFANQLANKIPTTYLEYPIIAKDGTEIWIGQNLQLIIEDDKITGFQAVARNITDRKKIEITCKESEENYRNLFDNANEAIFIIVDSKIVFFNPMTVKLVGYSPEELIEKSFSEFIHHDDRDMVVDRHMRRLKGEDVSTRYSFRLVPKYSRRQGDEIKWVETNTVVINWKGKTATLTFITDITERKLFEEALKESEEKYRNILESINDSYFEIDLRGNMTFFNSMVTKSLGYSPKEMMGMNHRRYVDTNNAEIVEKKISEAYKSNITSKIIDYEVIKKDGTKINVETLFSLIKNKEGRTIGYRGISRDITERKKAENMIRETNQILDAIINSSPVAIIALDIDGIVTRWNIAAEKMFGWEEYEILGQPLPYISEDTREEHLKLRKKVLSGEGFSSVEARRKKKDGSDIDISISTAPIYDIYGNINGIMSINIDITERKKIERNLYESEKRYRDMYDFLPIPVYEMNLNANVISANRAIYEVFGGSENDLKDNFSVWQILSAKDIERSKDNIRKLISGEQIGGTEYNLMRLDGSSFPAIVTSSVIYQDNKPVGLRGAVTDITDRKKAEEELIKSEEKYRNILESIEDGYYEVDLKGNFTFFNSSMCRLLGYSAEEMIGMNNRVYLSAENSKGVYATYNEVYKTGIPSNSTTWEIIKKDGTNRIFEVSISLIKLDETPVGFHGIARDITDYKRRKDD